MSDWVQSHSQWFNLQLPSLPQSLDCSQGTQTPNLLYPHLVLMTSSHPESSLLINIQHGFQPDLIATWNWVYYQYWWNKLSTVVFPYLRFHFSFSYLWSTTIWKQKIPEMTNNSCLFNWVPFQVAGWSATLFCSVLLRMEILLSRISALYILSLPIKSLGHLGYQTVMVPHSRNLL